MPAKLIKNFGGLMLEVEVVEWSEHLFHAAYTIDGNYAVTLKCIRTKDYPEGEITVSAARFMPDSAPAPNQTPTKTARVAAPGRRRGNPRDREATCRDLAELARSATRAADGVAGEA